MPLSIRSKVRLPQMSALREWGFGVLLRGDDPTAPPECTPLEWRMFLAIERTGVELQQKAAAVLDASAREVVDGVARTEVGHFLAAQAEMRAMAAAARIYGWRITVLKSNAVSGDGSAVDVMDLDLLIDGSVMADVAAFCVSRGDIVDATLRTLTVTPSRGAVAIDVHTRLDEWPYDSARGVPFGRHAPLLRMRAVDQAWHLLLHTVVKHPHRAGCLRDLTVLQVVLEAFSDEDSTELDQRIAGHAHSQQLRLVVDLASGAIREDRFANVALARYALFRRIQPTDSKPELSGIHTLAQIRLSGAGFPAPNHSADNPAQTDSTGIVRWLEQHVPPVGTLVRKALRRGAETAAMALAFVIQLETARALSAGRHTRHEDGPTASPIETESAPRP